MDAPVIKGEPNRNLRRFARSSWVGLLYLLPLVLAADTIRLKSGQIVTGTWIGADSREMRIAVGDRVQTIAISELARIDFGDSPSVSIPTQGATPTVPAKPDITNKQAQFCEVIAAYRTEVTRAVNEPNPIIRAKMREPESADYGGRLAAILGTSGEFDSWHGTVKFHVTGQWVVLEFTPECKPPQGIAFATANSPQTREGAQTVIPLNSPVARTLSQVKSNDPVMASGHLLYTGGKSTYRGSPDNPNPSVASPHYLAVFNNVIVKPK
jgi:hypothetical protein